MKKILPLLPLLLGHAFSPAIASVYADLENREVVGIKDGKPLVVISNGKSEVRYSNQKAKIPVGTNDLPDGAKIKVPMNPAGFEFYFNEFKKRDIPGKGDFNHPKLQNPIDCEYYFDIDSEKIRCHNYLTKKKCARLNTYSIETKNYPVDGEKRVLQWLRHLDPGNSYPKKMSCEKSKLVIGCRGGRCWGVPSSGEYGFYPGKWNTISIDGRKWGFEGNLSRQQELEIWNAIKDGSRFAYQLVHWPYDSSVTGSQTLSLPKGLKDKLYRMSLEKP